MGASDLMAGQQGISLKRRKGIRQILISLAAGICFKSLSDPTCMASCNTIQNEPVS
jgi:hypothetical protein